MKREPVVAFQASRGRGGIEGQLDSEYKYELHFSRDLIQVKVTLTRLHDCGYQALNEERKNGGTISSKDLIREVVL